MPFSFSSTGIAFKVSAARVKHTLFAVVAILFLHGCQYPLDEDNFQEKSIPDASSIDLSQFSEEATLFIRATTNFTVSLLNYDKRIIYDSRALVDGEFLAQSYGFPRLDFRLDPLAYSTGVHTLQIVFALSSGSGSLADMAEAERLTVTKKWKFEVDTDAPSKVDFVDAFFHDGAIKVEWSEYDRKNFSHYVLNYASFQEEINSIHTTSFIDTTYVGGERSYSLQVYNEQNYASSPVTKSLNDDGLRIAEMKIEDQKLKVKWNRSKYHNAFRSYIIRDWKTGALSEKTSIMDTSIVLDPAGIELGFAQDVLIATVSKAYDPGIYNSLHGYPTETVKLFQGRNVADHVVTQHLISNNSVYTRSQGKVFRLDANNLDTLAMTDQLIDILKVSKNGEYAYSVHSSTVFKRDPSTLATEEVIGINTLVGQNNVRVTGLFVSNDNRIALESWGQYWIIDMNTNSVLRHSAASLNALNFSADFTFLFDGVKLYGYDGGSYTELMNMAGSSYKVEFNSNFPDEAILLETDVRKVTIVKPWTNTVVRVFFTKDHSSWMIIDETTNLGLFVGGNQNNIYDLSTGNLKMDLGYTAAGNRYYTLFNNHLYRNSYFISLDHYQR